MAVTDNVSVMRSGEMVAHLKTSDTSAEKLAELMVGRPVLLAVGYEGAQAGDICLQVNSLGLRDESGKTCLQDICFEVRRGEIFGIAGVSGNGQSELLEVLAGITTPQEGSIQIGIAEISAKTPLSPAGIKELGVAHIPEDRHAMGLVLPFSAAESAMLGYEERGTASGSSVFLSPETITSHCQKIMTDFDIRPAESAPEKQFIFRWQPAKNRGRARDICPAGYIAGGSANQRVDIGAIEFIHKQLLGLRDRGCAVILVSVELDEILTLSDRIMVMNAGQNMGILKREEADIQKIGRMMAGIEHHASAQALA